MYFKLTEDNDLVNTIIAVLDKGDLHETEFFIFTEIWVFEIVFYKKN